MTLKNFASLILILLGTALAAAPAAFCAEIGTVLVSDLNVRSGPGIGFPPVTRLSKGLEVRIVGREKGWLKVERNGLTGYIRHRPQFIRITAINESPVATQPQSGQAGLKNSHQDTEKIQEKLRASQGEVASMARREEAVLKEFNETEQALSRTRRQVHAAQAGLAALEDKITEITRHSADLEKEIRSNAAYASQRLVALYKLNWVGRIQLLATADSFFDFVHRKSSLECILDQDEALLQKLHQDRMALESLLEQLNSKKAEKRSLELTLKDRLDKLKAAQKQRTALLHTIRSEKAVALAALAELKEAARELDATVQDLKPAEPVSLNAPKAAERHKSFDAYKGLLSWPVRGKIISLFGPYRDEKYKVMNFQSGINIQAERGEPIRAVSDGYTIFANWFKGFGNMIIIDHGNHYYTVYAHLEEVFKVKGDQVQKGEVIATVGDSGSLMGPALHFEVRYHGKPMDPLDWIKKG